MAIMALFVCPVLQTARGFVQLSVLHRPNNRMLSEHRASRLMKDIWLPTGKGQAPEQPVWAHKDRLSISRLCSTGHPPLLWLTLLFPSFAGTTPSYSAVKVWTGLGFIGSLQTVSVVWFCLVRTLQDTLVLVQWVRLRTTDRKVVSTNHEEQWVNIYCF